MSVNEEVKIMWKRAVVVAYFNVLYPNSLEVTEKK
jgi:hypothetical protein